jgi:hypothetical protein
MLAGGISTRGPLDHIAASGPIPRLFQLSRRRLRRGIADLYGRAQLIPKTAAPYLDAFATVDDTTTLDQLLERLEPPRQCHGRRVRAFRPLADERAPLRH